MKIFFVKTSLFMVGIYEEGFFVSIEF